MLLTIFVSGNRSIFGAFRRSGSGDSRPGSSTALAPGGFGERVRRARALYPGRYAILKATPPATVRRLHRRRATGYKLLGGADHSRVSFASVGASSTIGASILGLVNAALLGLFVPVCHLPVQHAFFTVGYQKDRRGVSPSGQSRIKARPRRSMEHNDGHRPYGKPVSHRQNTERDQALLRTSTGKAKPRPDARTGLCRGVRFIRR